MAVLVIGLGSDGAGDDGIGIAVVEALRREACDGIRTELVSDPSELVRLLATSDPVIIVDAVVGVDSPVGTVDVHEDGALSSLPQSSVSTHGIGVGQAIELARVVHSNAFSPRIALVGIHIDPPKAYGFEPSAPVAAALTVAKLRVLSLCKRFHA